MLCVSVQVAFAGFVAECVEDKHGDVNIKLFAVLGDTKVAAVHCAGGSAQACATGVFKLLAGFEQGLMADYA